MRYEIPNNAIITAINSKYLEEINNKTFEGLCITTNKGDIKILIDNNQFCCESWGSEFLETPDDVSKHIGATLISVDDIEIPSSRSDDEYGEETQLRITTSAGIIQYAVYNSHNGYYAHATFKEVFDTIKVDSL